MSRKRLAELGYHSDMNRLPNWKAEAFVLISSYIDNLVAKENKKRASQKKRRG